MGQALSRWNKLRAERDRMLKKNKQIQAYRGNEFPGWSAVLFDKHRESLLSYLDNQITALEDEALKEAEREAAEATLKEINQAGTQAGKELVEAIQSAFNSRI